MLPFLKILLKGEFIDGAQQWVLGGAGRWKQLPIGLIGR